jgi:type VI secretion system protein ImpC
VETASGTRKVELPFVVGVLADLSGQPEEALLPLRERKFVPIDRDNFNDAIEKCVPRVVLRVRNRLADQGSWLAVELKFKTLQDFEPARIVEQVDLLRELATARISPRATPESLKDIDRKLSVQLAEILHHADFQRLEATWRGLHYLVHQTETGENLKIRVLNVSKRELLKDFEEAGPIDRSALFQKVHERVYGRPGGQPFGLLVGEYEFGRIDIYLLEWIARVAAFAHAPFVAGASPKLFGLDNFTELTRNRDLAKIFEGVAYAPWKSFRESEDSRYVALVLPHVLARLPYGEKFQCVAEFNFEEFVNGERHDKYLWMSAAWAYAVRVTVAFGRYGWLARTRGVHGGGKAEGLPLHAFPTDDGDIAMKCPAEIAISDRREFELSNQGFLPLLYSIDNDTAVFMGAQSCQKSPKYFDQAANTNAELYAEINVVLCLSRFVHYLKLMARDSIGAFVESMDCGRWLNKWIANYVVDPNGASDELKAKRPLAEAWVEVRPREGKPGWYEVVAYLGPHFQFEDMTLAMRLVAEIPKLRE